MKIAPVAFGGENRLMVVREESDGSLTTMFAQFSSGNATLEHSLRFLILRDFWARDSGVFDFFARLGNEQLSPFVPSYLNYLPGSATAEQELRASYDQHFRLRGQASLNARIDKQTRLTWGRWRPREFGIFKTAVFWEGHLRRMLPNVCNTVRQAPGEPLSQLRIADGQASEEAGEITFAVTLDTARWSEPVSVSWHTTGFGGGMSSWYFPEFDVPEASVDADFVYGRGSLTFAPGETHKEFTVEIIDDGVDEPPEHFLVQIDDASENALIVDGFALAMVEGELPAARTDVPVARFEHAPLTHDGVSPFTVQLRFTEEVAVNGAELSSGLVSITDGRMGEASVVAREGKTGKASLADADSRLAWEFSVTPDGGQDVVITLPKPYGCDVQPAVCTPDGRSLIQDTTVTVRGPASPRVSATPDSLHIISVSTYKVMEGGTAVATLAAEDADAGAAELEWSLSGGADQEQFRITSSGALSFAEAKDYEAPDDADADGSYLVTVQVSDGERTATADILVALLNGNDAPLVSAGADQADIEPGGTVTLSGAVTVDEGDARDTFSYAWTQTSGPAVTLNNANTATASFTAPSNLTEDATLVFSLKVEDAEGLHAEDTVTVTIRASAGPPSGSGAEPEASWGERLPDRDIELPSGSDPSGLWSDGTTLWVISNRSTGEVTTYSLADGTALGAGGVTLSNGTSAAHRFLLQGDEYPAGLWSDGETLWVADLASKVSAYRLSDGARQEVQDVPRTVLAAAGITSPSGLWSDGQTLWVADHGGWKVFAFRLSDKVRVPEKEFDLLTENSRLLTPWGLWSDGETALATLYFDGGVRGYALSGGALVAERTLDGSVTGQHPLGLWSDSETLWVVNRGDPKIRAYAVPGLRPAAAPAASSVMDPFSVRVVTRVEAAPGVVDAGPPVFIADAALHGAIAEALGLNSDQPVGLNAMARIRSLDVRGAGIAELTGLEYAVNLEALDLGHNPVRDPWTLALLPRLTVLNLDGAASDLYSLSGLVGLERLSLRNSGLTDVSALAGLVNLRHLSLRGNQLSDLWPLAGLAQLEILDLRGVTVPDQAPLSGLYKLRHLDLTDASHQTD